VLCREPARESNSDGLMLLARDGLLEGVKILASDWEDSVRTVERNTSEKDIQPDLHGRTEFDNIPVEREGEIRQWILEEGGKFHKRFAATLRGLIEIINPRPRVARVSEINSD
jgi:hypothetical protein